MCLHVLEGCRTVPSAAWLLSFNMLLDQWSQWDYIHSWLQLGWPSHIDTVKQYLKCNSLFFKNLDRKKKQLRFQFQQEWKSGDGYLFIYYLYRDWRYRCSKSHQVIRLLCTSWSTHTQWPLSGSLSLSGSRPTAVLSTCRHIDKLVSFLFFLSLQTKHCLFVRKIRGQLTHAN